MAGLLGSLNFTEERERESQGRHKERGEGGYNNSSSGFSSSGVTAASEEAAEAQTEIDGRRPQSGPNQPTLFSPRKS